MLLITILIVSKILFLLYIRILVQKTTIIELKQKNSQNISSINTNSNKESMSNDILINSNKNTNNVNNTNTVYTENPKNNINNCVSLHLSPEIYFEIKPTPFNNININIIDTENAKSKLKSTLNIHCKYNNNSNSSNVITQSFNNNSIDSKSYILICDDSKPILDSLERLLLSIPQITNNYLIVRASDGSSLISSVLEKQLDGRLELVLTDENMEYINGSHAIGILKSLEAQGKVSIGTRYVSITAFEDEVTRRNIYNSGADRILSKPVSKKELELLLEDFNLLYYIFTI